jgi:outer membrane protein OmpA-like peptidoglycan-associated protein
MLGSTVLRRSLAAAGAVAVVAALAGCSGAAPKPTGGLVIVIGGRSNDALPTLDGSASGALETALANQSYLSIVVADGKPFIAQKGSLLTPAANAVARTQEREANRAKVTAALRSAQAKTPETDLLTALTLGARSVHDSRGRHTIVVVDSGISTAGPVNFTQPGMPDVDASDLAAQLRAAKELPDLAGADVLFEGIGDSAEPQVTPDNARRQWLIGVWTAIAKASGASSATVVSTPLQGRPAATLPPVTPVNWSQGLTCTPSTVVLTGGDVAFRPDSAQFLDRSAAVATVRPIAEQLIDSGGIATLTGTTANVGDMAGQRKLSLERAQAVMGLLVGLGVPSGHLSAVGVGSDFPGYVQDHDGSGRLIAAAAAQNRKVIIAPVGSGRLACAASTTAP